MSDIEIKGYGYYVNDDYVRYQVGNDKGFDLEAKNYEVNVKKLRELRKNTDIYYGVYTVNMPLKDYLTGIKIQSPSDYPIFSPFYIDIDNKNLEVSKEWLVKALDYIRNAWKVPDSNIIVYFSGAKGFHVFILYAKEFLPKLNDAYKELVNELTENAKITVDVKIYDINRLIRVNNSINSKSGLYKIQLSVNEAYSLTIEQIKELAKQERTLPEPELVLLESFLERVKHAFKSSNEKTNKINELSKDFVPVKLDERNYPPCIKRLLEGVDDGYRHNALFSLTVFLKGQGVSRDEVYRKILEVSNKCRPAGDEVKAISIVNDVFNNDYTIGCKRDGFLRDFSTPNECLTLCPFINNKREKYEESSTQIKKKVYDNIINYNYKQRVCVDNHPNAREYGFTKIFKTDDFLKVFFLEDALTPSKIRELLMELMSSMLDEKYYFITPQRVIKGKNVGCLSENKELVTVLQHIITTTGRKDNKDATEGLIILGEKLPKGSEVKESYHLPVYVYTFVGEDDLKYTLLSIEKLPLGFVEVSGNKYLINNKIEITKNSNIISSNRLILVYSCKPLETKITPERFNEFTKIGFSQIKNHIFNCYTQPKGFEWVEKLDLACTFSSPFNGYPINYGKLGWENCNKSKSLTTIHKALCESQPIVAGSSSRLKAVTPSYKTSPPSAGAFLNAQRLCAVDEFLKMFNVESEAGNNDRVKDRLDSLNNLLEWQEHCYGAGTGKIALRSVPTARFFFNSNYTDLNRNISAQSGVTINDLLVEEYMSFFSRVLLFCITREHKKALTDNRKTKLDEVKSVINPDDFVKIYDFMVSQSIDFTKDVLNFIKDIHLLVESKLNACYTQTDGKQIPIYPLAHRYWTNSRMMDILCGLFDGLIKVRCFETCKWDLEIKESDKKTFCDIVLNLVKSWFDSDDNTSKNMIKSIDEAFK